MARNRNYSAEYQARKARTMAQHGVGYGAYKHAQDKARAQGVTGREFTQQAGRLGFRNVKQLTDAAATRAEAKRAGRYVPYVDELIDFDVPDDMDIEWFYYH